MRRSPFAVSLLGLVVVGVALTGCATGTTSAGDPPTAEPSVEPTPEPTVEPVVIGPAEMPPVAFDGDCAKALSTADVEAVIGAGSSLHQSDLERPTQIDNAGGLHCLWIAPEAQLALDVIPRSGLGDAVFPDYWSEAYFETCSNGWVCSWEGGNDAVWLAVTITDEGMTRAEVDAHGEALEPRVLANFTAAGGAPWTRDRTGWWPAFDCADLARAVGAQAGVALTGETRMFEDRPFPGGLMAEVGAGASTCTLYDDAGTVAGTVITDPGLGAPNSLGDGEPVDLGSPEVTALTSAWSDTYAWYGMSDGVNRVTVEAAQSSIGTPEQLAVAVAAAAASDFQP